MKKCLLIIMLLCILTGFSCARSGSNPMKRASEDKKNSFNIKGEVLWEGKRYIVYPVATASYRGACGKRKGVQLIRIKKPRTWHRRILDVAVWLEPVWEDMTPEEIENLTLYRKSHYPETLEIEEKLCEFVPRLSVVPVGTRVEIANEDRKDHWVVVEGKHLKRKQYVQIYGEAPPEFTLDTPNIHMVPEGAPVSFTAKKVDQIHLQSGFHLWMEGWIFVTDKIWYGKVCENGYFEFNNIPKGVYRVNTWHPLLGRNSTIVKVPEEARGLVAVGYKETPEQMEEITSTFETSYGEAREEDKIWQEIEVW